MKLRELLEAKTPEARAALMKPPARCARCGEPIIADDGPCDSYPIGSGKEDRDGPEEIPEKAGDLVPVHPG